MVVMVLWLDMGHPLRSSVGGGFMLNHKLAYRCCAFL